MLESALISIGLPALAFIAGLIIDRFIRGSENERLFAAVLHLIEVLLERFDVDVPEFLQELLKGMHDLELDTKRYESIVLDDLNKLEK